MSHTRRAGVVWERFTRHGLWLSRGEATKQITELILLDAVVIFDNFHMSTFLLMSGGPQASLAPILKIWYKGQYTTWQVRSLGYIHSFTLVLFL